MSGPDESSDGVDGPVEGASVLANLPRTRPQRATPRRAAARRSGEAEIALKTSMTPVKRPVRQPRVITATAQPDAGKPAKSRTKAARAARRPAARGSSATTEQVPRQGYECDVERASGPVSPPGGIELLASAAELLGELTKASVTTGERLLRDVLTRIPGA